MSTIIKVPLRIYSIANMTEHWSAKYKRNKNNKNIILGHLKGLPKPDIPCVVKLTRIAPRSLDIDNLWASMKNLIDICADWIVPGMRPGRADGTPGLKFECDQEKGEPKEYALLIELSSN